MPEDVAAQRRAARVALAAPPAGTAPGSGRRCRSRTRPRRRTRRRPGRPARRPSRRGVRILPSRSNSAVPVLAITGGPGTSSRPRPLPDGDDAAQHRAQRGGLGRRSAASRRPGRTTSTDFTSRGTTVLPGLDRRHHGRHRHRRREDAALPDQVGGRLGLRLRRPAPRRSTPGSRGRGRSRGRARRPRRRGRRRPSLAGLGDEGGVAGVRDRRAQRDLAERAARVVVVVLERLAVDDDPCWCTARRCPASARPAAAPGC